MGLGGCIRVVFFLGGGMRLRGILAHYETPYWLGGYDANTFGFTVAKESIHFYEGCFRKWWYPQNTPKWSFLVGKPMVVGYHHFRKPPWREIPFFLSFFAYPPCTSVFRAECNLLTIRISDGISAPLFSVLEIRSFRKKKLCFVSTLKKNLPLQSGWFFFWDPRTVWSISSYSQVLNFITWVLKAGTRTPSSGAQILRAAVPSVPLQIEAAWLYPTSNKELWFGSRVMHGK